MWRPSSATFSTVNSIIALNRAGAASDDCHGAFDSDGGNLVGNVGGCTGFGGTDVLGPNPKLGQLADNGGPTKTLALKQGSPAIGKARKVSAPRVDQRGRKRDAHPDIVGPSNAFPRGLAEVRNQTRFPAPGSDKVPAGPRPPTPNPVLRSQMLSIRKRALALVVATAATAALVAGCGSSSDNSPTPTPLSLKISEKGQQASFDAPEVRHRRARDGQPDQRGQGSARRGVHPVHGQPHAG